MLPEEDFSTTFLWNPRVWDNYGFGILVERMYRVVLMTEHVFMMTELTFFA
jgi:hypothetical protein